MRRLHDWFFDPCPQYWAVLARIGFGLVLFSAHASFAWDVPAFFGPEGIGGFATKARIGPPVGLPEPIAIPHAILDDVSSMAIVWALYALLLASALAFAFGLFTRTSGCLLVLLHTMFLARFDVLFWGWSRMIGPFILYVVLSDPGRHLSLDARLFRRGSGAPSAADGPRWPRRLLQVHVCTMYLVAGWSRLESEGWLSGEMLYFALSYTLFARLDADWHLWRPALRVLSYGVFLLEPLAPAALWLPRIRPWWVFALIAMHLALEALTMVGWWNFMMITALTSFFSDDRLRRLFAEPTLREPSSSRGRSWSRHARG